MWIYKIHEKRLDGRNGDSSLSFILSLWDQKCDVRHGVYTEEAREKEERQSGS